MKYPKYAHELLHMAEEDQYDARNMSRIMDNPFGLVLINLL